MRSRSVKKSRVLTVAGAEQDNRMEVVKLVGTLSAADMTKGVVFAGAFLLFVKALTAIVKSSNGSHTISGLNKLLLSISVSMALMAGVVKIVGTLSADYKHNIKCYRSTCGGGAYACYWTYRYGGMALSLHICN